MSASRNIQVALPLRARRHPVIAQIREDWRAQCPATPDAPIVIACSSGVDSTALLVASAVLREQHAQHVGAGFGEIIVAHVHHHLREDADVDAAHVAELSDRLGVRHVRCDVHPGERPGNVSANARDLRYAMLGEVARDVDARHVIVAHQADDQAETMLMAFARGTGLDGLSGLRWRRPFGDGLTLDRPLLRIRRSVLEEFLVDAGIAWREDPGNRSRTSRRSFVRHEILPALESRWPGVADRVTATADLLDAAGTLLEAELERRFGGTSQMVWSRSELRELPLPLLCAGLRRAALAAAPDLHDDLTADQLGLVARAIGDDAGHPRVWNWSSSMNVVVTSRTVELQPRCGGAHLNVEGEDDAGAL
jgi:tRNA(Ile)-lysidine synthase